MIRELLGIARREVSRHRQRYIGLTASVPQLKDVEGKFEYVADVRVGQEYDSQVVQNVLVAMQQPGIISDINVPVIVERSPEGQLAIVGRAQVNLPDIRINTYSYNDLDMVFMAQLTQDSAGVYRDGYGHEMIDPTTETGTETNYEWLITLRQFDDVDWDSDKFWESSAAWTEV